MIQRLRFAALLCLCLFSHFSLAIGIGTITMQSRLGEKLSLSAPLLGAQNLSNHDIGVSIADNAAYQAAGIDLQAFHHSLRFAISRDLANNASLIVTSTQALKSPYLHFLLKIQTADQTLLKEVKVLVKLPEQ